MIIHTFTTAVSPDTCRFTLRTIISTLLVYVFGMFKLAGNLTLDLLSSHTVKPYTRRENVVVIPWSHKLKQNGWSQQSLRTEKLLIHLPACVLLMRFKKHPFLSLTNSRPNFLHNFAFLFNNSKWFDVIFSVTACI